MGTRRNKAKMEIDLSEFVDNKKRRNEVHIMNEALEHYDISTDISMEDVSIKRERVKNYSAGMLTVRYKGKLLYRRFPMDVEGLKFRYESPIFNNVSD